MKEVKGFWKYVEVLLSFVVCKDLFLELGPSGFHGLSLKARLYLGKFTILSHYHWTATDVNTIRNILPLIQWYVSFCGNEGCLPSLRGQSGRFTVWVNVKQLVRESHLPFRLINKNSFKFKAQNWYQTEGLTRRELKFPFGTFRRDRTIRRGLTFQTFRSTPGNFSLERLVNRRKLRHLPFTFQPEFP